jgi:hypothetical protein
VWLSYPAPQECGMAAWTRTVRHEKLSATRTLHNDNCNTHTLYTAGALTHMLAEYVPGEHSCCWTSTVNTLPHTSAMTMQSNTFEYGFLCKLEYKST